MGSPLPRDGAAAPQAPLCPDGARGGGPPGRPSLLHPQKHGRSYAPRQALPLRTAGTPPPGTGIRQAVRVLSERQRAYEHVRKTLGYRLSYTSIIRQSFSDTRWRGMGEVLRSQERCPTITCLPESLLRLYTKVKQVLGRDEQVLWV